MERLPNIRHLAAVAATVEHGSLTKAARSINLTQPALTQAIARLERDLDCVLFEREPDGMRALEPAKVLAPRVRAAIAQIGSSRITGTQIRAFLALSQAGTYAAAAETNGVAAASLHRAVADLSLALGEKLIERRGQHLILTRKGQSRARSFGLAMAELRSGLAEVSTWLGRTGARVVIGAMPLSRAMWLPQAIRQFRQTHPKVEVAVIEGSHGELVTPLRSGDVDFLLGALRQDRSVEDLVQEAVFEDRPQIIMPPHHELARTQRLSSEHLRRYPWVLPAPATPLRRYWEEMMGGDGTPIPQVMIECGSVLTMRELLLESDMLTLLSPDQLRVEIDAGLLIARPPPSPIKRTIGITTRQNWHPTSSQRAMLDLLRPYQNAS